MRTSRGRRKGLTVEQLVERFDEMNGEDVGYRRQTAAVRRATRRLMPLLNDKARDQYLEVEDAMIARDTYCNDAVAQWAYWLGFRDGATPMPRVRVRKRAVKGLRYLRRAPPK